jgi:hypothetical protein
MKFSVSVHFLPNGITHSTTFNSNFTYGLCYEEIQVMFEFGHGSMNFGRVMPLLLENDMKFSVSVRYLPNGITHSTQN